MKIEGAKVAVIGMASSGLAAVELLCRHGARVTALDSKDATALGDAALRLEALGVPLLRQAEGPLLESDLIVVSPGVPADLPELEAARRRKIPVVGEIELGCWFLKGKVIGVTGTNGKTTTTALVGHLLKSCGIPCQIGGNIGPPLCALVTASTPEMWTVLELSSFQLETIQHFRAAIGVVLNITPDHLDRHHTLENYIAAKARLFENQQPEDFAVLNAEDAVTASLASRTRAAVWWFSSKRRVEPGLWCEQGCIRLGGERLARVEDLQIRGTHNVENAMAACAAAHLAGASISGLAGALPAFRAVEHRLEFVRLVGGVSYYNDSKATNVDATLKALEAFSQGVWLILGGKDKGSDYRPLAPAMQGKTKAVLLIGAAADRIAKHLEGKTPMVHCGTLAGAIEYARRHAAPGDTVLLSPACASFDQFQNFEHRGRVFKELVAALESREGGL